MDTSLQYLRQQIRQAADEGYALTVRGGGSKDFYGESARPATILDTRIHSGITAYDPDELVITAKAGTPLAEIEAAGRRVADGTGLFAAQKRIAGRWLY